MNFEEKSNHAVARIIDAFSVSEDVEKILHLTLDRHLRNAACPQLVHPLYTCVKELLMNAVKANFKSLFFEEFTPQSIRKDDHSLDLNYQSVLDVFKLEMSREEACNLERIARKKNLKAEILLEVADENLFISVFNPVKMMQIEQDNISRKLLDARQCSDMSEYFKNIADDPNREGAGLGLVLIMMILKSLGLNDSFTINATGRGTRATLRIPLDRNSVERYNQRIQ